MTVGLVLERNNPADPLLSGNWAERQAALGAFSSPADLWAIYGANTGSYNTVLASVPGDALNRANQLGYVSSAADRTIWANFTAAEFSNSSVLRRPTSTPSRRTPIPANSLFSPGRAA